MARSRVRDAVYLKQELVTDFRLCELWMEKDPSS